VIGGIGEKSPAFLMRSLSPNFIHKLVSHLETENTLGIALSGSFARGDGDTYSDVDIWHYLRQEVAGGNEPYLDIMDGYLVSIKTTQIEKDYAGMQNPKRAIWVVPALRQARILLDNDGEVAALFEAARNFTWESLRTEADAFASHTVAGTAEEIYKILDGLAKKSESKTLYAIWSLTQWLADALLVQHGVLIPTENVYIDHAQAEAGRSSEWTRQFRLAIGLDPLPAGQPAFIGYGIAGLRLYRETAHLLKKRLLPKDACIVERALEMIREAGYS
jgi:predicted nucleotidyltransferase